jgi:hypothetical protein
MFPTTEKDKQWLHSQKVLEIKMQSAIDFRTQGKKLLKKGRQCVLGVGSHLKAHRTAASVLKKGCSLLYRAHQGRLNSKLHVVRDGHGKPVAMLLSEGQMSDYKGARMLLPSLPKAKTLIADRGYDAAWSGQRCKPKA